MKFNRRMIANIIEILVGLSLIVLGNMGAIEEFWSGMGTALVMIGVVYLIQQIRYTTDKEYKENREVENNDERKKFLRTKAWSWTGYLFFMFIACSVIVLKFAGLDHYMMIASGCTCFMMIVYWICFWILSKKY